MEPRRFVAPLSIIPYALPFGVSPFFSLICFAWIASCHRPVPAGMMCPGPHLSYSPVNHRAKCSRLMSRALIDVNDEATQHNQRRDIMKHITYDNYDPGNCFIEPHQQTS